jgi:DNA-binding HxlR family transcriptional regulator
MSTPAATPPNSSEAGTKSGEESHTPDDYCPIAATLNLLNGRWTLHILRALMPGPLRFNELGRAVGSVSSRTLCCRLRTLEEEGIVVRKIKTTIPPWVEYGLTEKGLALSAVLQSIAQWGRTYMSHPSPHHGALDPCAFVEEPQES